MELTDFLGGTSPGRSVALSSADTMNFYPEVSDDGAKKKIVLIGTPGKIKYTNLTGYGACRKLYATALGRLFAVVGNRFIEVIDATHSTTIKTTDGNNLDTNEGIITIAENNFELMLSDGTSGYIYNIVDFTDSQGTAHTAGTLEKIVSDGYHAGNSVISVNGRFIQNVNNSSDFIYSSYNDGFTWNALSFYNAERSSDYIDAIGTINNELWLFGKKSTEIWYSHAPAADADMDDIYSRVNNAFINIGIGAPQSVATINNNIFWLGSNLEGNNIVYMASGYVPTRISDHSMEYLIGQLQHTSDAISYCYQQEGHNFYVLTFVTDNVTIVYDLNAGLWHKRGYWNKFTGLNDADRGNCCVFWNSKNYVGDYKSGAIYELSLDCYADNGNPIVRWRTGPHIEQDRKRLFFDEFELSMERGIGLTAGQGVDPQACLQWSDDEGNTWSNEYWNTPGKKGEYKSRIHWHRLGQARNRVFKVTVSDPVKWILTSARIDVRKEP